MIRIVTRRSAALVAVICLSGLSAAMPPAALAAEPVEIVHREQVQAGPYRLDLGFSHWPMLEGRSFDLVIDPDGGIAGKSGSLTVRTPTGAALEDFEEAPLVRHPRQRESWGLDVVAFTGDGAGGRWSIEFVVDGPSGRGEGRLAVLPLGPVPGPPQSFSWAVATVPTLVLATAAVLGWRRLRPGRDPQAWSITAAAP
ncbi:MAG: hypothetical protein ACRCSN_20795 [Dermatophilaceae bacterium]